MSNRTAVYLTSAFLIVLLFALMFVVLFYPQPMVSANPGATFADVPADHWANPWVEQAYAEGLTTGCGINELGDPIFCPDDVPTRAEWMVWLLKMEHGYDYQP
jgi:hypothetical protein